MIKEGEGSSLQRFLRQFGQYASRTTSERGCFFFLRPRKNPTKYTARYIVCNETRDYDLSPPPPSSREIERARRSRQRLFADFPVVFRSSRRADEKFFSAVSVILLPRKKSSFFQMDRSLGGNDHRLIVRLKSPPSSHRTSDKS